MEDSSVNEALGLDPGRCDPTFLPLLNDFNLLQLDHDPGTIYGLHPDFRLAYVNLAWGRFAAENGGEPEISTRWKIGCDVLAAISPVLRPFFLHHFSRCIREHQTWQHDYECSSAELYRKFRMLVYPLPQRHGLLVVNATRVEEAQHQAAHPPLDALYRAANGLVLQCCHCRRVRRVTSEVETDTWDWVPAWVTRIPENTSHGLCQVCEGYYYSDDYWKLGRPRP